MKISTRRATLLACSVAIAAFAVSAAARPHHQAAQTHAQTDAADADARYSVPAAALVQERHPRRLRMAAYRAAQAHSSSAYAGFTGNALVEEARKYIGTNPTGRSSLWCGAFMDMVLKRTGHLGGGNLAWGYSHYGTRVSGPQVGAIAVMGRQGGGHVGVVSGVDANGNPIIVSGNHNHTVAEAVYPRGRIAAYVMP